MDGRNRSVRKSTNEVGDVTPDDINERRSGLRSSRTTTGAARGSSGVSDGNRLPRNPDDRIQLQGSSRSPGGKPTTESSMKGARETERSPATSSRSSAKASAPGDSAGSCGVNTQTGDHETNEKREPTEKDVEHLRLDGPKGFGSEGNRSGLDTRPGPGNVKARAISAREREGSSIEVSYRSDMSSQDNQNFSSIYPQEHSRIEGEGLQSRRTTRDGDFRDNSRLSASTSIGGGVSSSVKESRSSKTRNEDQDSMDSADSRQNRTRSMNDELEEEGSNDELEEEGSNDEASKGNNDNSSVEINDIQTSSINILMEQLHQSRVQQDLILAQITAAQSKSESKKKRRISEGKSNQPSSTSLEMKATAIQEIVMNTSSSHDDQSHGSSVQEGDNYEGNQIEELDLMDEISIATDEFIANVMPTAVTHIQYDGREVDWKNLYRHILNSDVLDAVEYNRKPSDEEEEQWWQAGTNKRSRLETDINMRRNVGESLQIITNRERQAAIVREDDRYRVRSREYRPEITPIYSILRMVIRGIAVRRGQLGSSRENTEQWMRNHFLNRIRQHIGLNVASDEDIMDAIEQWVHKTSTIQGGGGDQQHYNLTPHSDSRKLYPYLTSISGRRNQYGAESQTIFANFRLMGATAGNRDILHLTNRQWDEDMYYQVMSLMTNNDVVYNHILAEIPKVDDDVARRILDSQLTHIRYTGIRIDNTNRMELTYASYAHYMDYIRKQAINASIHPDDTPEMLIQILQELVQLFWTAKIAGRTVTQTLEHYLEGQHPIDCKKYYGNHS